MLSTTEDFPEVFYPALDARPYTASVFYLVFLGWVLWVNLPILLGVTYDLYISEHHANLAKRALRRKKALVAAFRVLTGPHLPMSREAPTVDYQRFSMLVRLLRKRATYNDIRLLFFALDTDFTSAISEDEFLHLPRIINTSFQQMDRMNEGLAGTRAARARTLSSIRERDLKTFAQAVVPTVAFDIAVKVALVISVAPMFFWSVAINKAYNDCMHVGHPDEGEVDAADCQSEQLYVSQVISAVFIAALCVEQGLRIKAAGFLRYMDSKWNRFDFVATMLSAGASLLYLAFPLYTLTQTVNAGAQDLLGIPRGMRLMRILSVFKRFRTFVSTLGDCVAVALQLGVLYFATTYMFAVVGMELFGHLHGDSHSDTQRWSFTTFGGAMLVLLQLTVRRWPGRHDSRH